MKNIIVFLLLLLLFICSEMYSLEEWMYIYHPIITDSYVLKNIKKYKIICITGYKIDKNGNLNQYFSLEKFSSFFDKNQIVYPLISLVNSKEGKLFLENPEIRRKGIQNIIHLLSNDFWKGVHIDFEYLTKKETEYFALFLKELKLESSKINKKLTVALFPPIWEMKYKEFHNQEKLFPYIDEVVLMTYDYHNPKTKPGPISEINWVRSNLKETLKYFRKEQIYLGIPLYGYEWTIKTNQHKIVDNQYFIKILNSKNINKFVEKSRNFGTKINYEKNNIDFILYYPDPIFRENVRNVAKEYNLKGVAFWRLGFEK